ncbi:MAG TPA: SRPBCC family protein [Gemmatimonadaceae bacterium]|jgi:uncharacterized protein YndB with AHSA1/START domain
MKPAQATTPSDTEVRVSRTFNAPARLVWRAYTEPELMQRWMLGPPGWTMPVCEMDVKPRGKFRWRWQSIKNGKEFGFFGEYQEIEPYKRIVHTEYYDPGDMGDNMGNGCLITVAFEEAEGATTMTTSMKFNSQADRDAALSTGMTDGMELSYAQLDQLLDAEPLRV